MEVLIDIGNTTTGVCLYDRGEYRPYVVSSDKTRKKDEIKTLFQNLLEPSVFGVKPSGMALSSVVPELTYEVKGAMEELFGIESIILSKGIKNGLSIKIDNPSELGADLVADCVGGKEQHGYPLIVVDLGTATKVLAIDRNGAYIGGAIAPGLSLGAKGLSDMASLLPTIDLVAPKSSIGKNTIDSMNSGVVIGHAEMIIGLCRRFEGELGYSLKKVLTGGNASESIRSLLGDGFVYDPLLVYRGLHLIIGKNQ